MLVISMSVRKCLSPRVLQRHEELKVGVSGHVNLCIFMVVKVAQIDSRSGYF